MGEYPVALPPLCWKKGSGLRCQLGPFSKCIWAHIWLGPYSKITARPNLAIGKIRRDAYRYLIIAENIKTMQGIVKPPYEQARAGSCTAI